MMASLFGITGAEMARKIAPSADVYQFSVGSGEDDDITEALLLSDVIEPAEQEVLGYLKLKYQRLIRRVEGEVVVRSAAGGETTLTAGLSPIVESSVKVYVNFPPTRAWRERRPSDALEASAFEVTDAANGVIELATALNVGDRVFLEYEHAAVPGLLDLRKDVMGLAAAELSRRFAYFKSAEGFDRFEQWERDARAHLRDMGRNDGMSIELFERLELVMETRSNSIADIIG